MTTATDTAESPLDADTLAVMTLVARGKVTVRDGGYYPAGPARGEFAAAVGGIIAALIEERIVSQQAPDRLILTDVGWALLGRYAPSAAADVAAGLDPAPDYDRYDDRYT